MSVRGEDSKNLRLTLADGGEASPPFAREDERARLRRDAEASANSVTLSPCQGVSDYALRPAPPKD